MIDSHSHIGFEELKDNVDEIVERARVQGIEKILTVACGLNQLSDLKDILDRHEIVYGSFGIHPNEVKEIIVSDKLEKIILSHPKIIGVGETGLDYHYEYASRELQKESFKIHIELSDKLKKPLVIHAREADEDTIRILTDVAKKEDIRGVMHCFTGSEELALAALNLGLYISASGVITFGKAGDLREIFKKIPLDRLLVETDAPYLAPIPYRGKVNEPAYLPHTIKVLAEIKGISSEEMAQITSQNFKKLFKV